MPSAAPSRAREALSSPWLKRGLALAGVAALAVFTFRDAIFGTPVHVHSIVRGDLVQTVVASGRVTTPQRVSVGAVTTDWVARIPVVEGQSVRRGDVLLELDDRDERAALGQAQAAVAQAEAKLRQLREVALPAAEHALAQADANLHLARSQYQRSVDLKARGFVSAQAQDDARRNLEVAESQRRAAALQVDTMGSSGSDTLVAQTALGQARAALAAAATKLEQTTIRAPADGVLIARSIEPGDVVQPGRELMALAPAGETQIVVQIDEKNLAQLELGQKAIASADAYPRERFGAEIFYINPGVDALRGSVEVKLRVPEPPMYLRQDMTVSVDIEVKRRMATLVASADAVRDAAGRQPWVLAVVDGRAVKRPVTLGARGAGRVEILAGATAGDRLLPVSAGIAPGARVRVASESASEPKP